MGSMRTCLTYPCGMDTAGNCGFCGPRQPAYAPVDDGGTQRRVDLERADAARQAVEDAVKRIEQLDGNEIYRKAWKVAVRAVRGVTQG